MNIESSFNKRIIRSRFVCMSIQATKEKMYLRIGGGGGVDSAAVECCRLKVLQEIPVCVGEIETCAH